MSNEKNTEGLNLSKKYATVLIKPTEKVISTYGNDYFQNIVVTKNFESFSFILSDKRLYYKGTNYVPTGKMIIYKIVEETLDVDAITKSGFEYVNPSPIGEYITGGILISISFIFLAIGGSVSLIIYFLLFGFGVGCVLGGLIKQFLGKYTMIKVDYAGGSLCGNIKLYGEESARDFLKQVKRVQDEYKK